MLHSPIDLLNSKILALSNSKSTCVAQIIGFALYRGNRLWEQEKVLFLGFPHFTHNVFERFLPQDP